MSKFIVLAVSLAIGPVFIVAICFAAPGSKEREEKLAQPTAEQFAKSDKNLKHIGLGIHDYASTNQDGIPHNIYKEGKAILSWRVQILPHIEEEALYKAFKLDEPWDSEHNKKLIDKMPKIYAPIRVKAENGLTFYQSFADAKGQLLIHRFDIGNIPDGTRNTFAVVEALKPVIWTKPTDLEYDRKNLPKLGGMFDGKFHALMFDGSIKRFRKGIDELTLMRLIEPADGNVLPDDLGEDYEK